RVKGRLDVDTGKLAVTAYQLAVALPQADKENMEKPAEQARDAGVGLVVAMNNAIQPNTMAARSLAADSATSTAAEQKVREIVAAYGNALQACQPPSSPLCKPQDLDRIISDWRTVRADITAMLPDGSQYKALYNLANFDPWRYQRIYNDSAATV